MADPRVLTLDDIEQLRNDLHRHQDEDREDFKNVRTDIALGRAEVAANLVQVRAEAATNMASVKSDIAGVSREISEYRGGMKTLKFMALITVPSALAAAGAAIFNLVRHW